MVQRILFSLVIFLLSRDNLLTTRDLTEQQERRTLMNIFTRMLLIAAKPGAAPDRGRHTGFRATPRRCKRPVR